MSNSRIFRGIHRFPKLPRMGLSRPKISPPVDENNNSPSASEIFSNVPMHIMSLNIDGHIDVVAPGDCEYFSSTNGKNLKAWVSEQVHVQDRVAVFHAVDACQSGKGARTEEFRTLKLEGQTDIPQWVEIKCIPIAGKKSIIVVMHDITNQKNIEQKMRAAVDHADSISTAKSRFLANMSHELRTPLNAIIGFSELLKSGMIPKNNHDKTDEYHGLIHDSAHHLLKVLNDILDMSKIEAGKYEINTEEIDVYESIDVCSKMLAPLAIKADVKLEYNRPDEPARFEADVRAIRQIIINLVSNAIKFSKKNGTVRIDAKRVGRNMLLTVSDDGCGMEAQHMDGLGQPFYQADTANNRNHEGTGLGLSIVRGLVELHRGEISFESEPDEGTIVSVKLPVAQTMGTPIPGEECESIIRIGPLDYEQDPIQLNRLAGAGSNG